MVGNVQSWSDSKITVAIPYIDAGLYDIQIISNRGKESNVYNNFEILSGPQTAVRFKVNNAYTSYGNNVYLVGNIHELGNWDITRAVGPLFNSTSTIGNYPTWFYDVNVPAATTVEYKFIKLDGTGNVIWESGNNHTYVTPSSATSTVTVDWQE